MTREPRWLSRAVLDAIQHELIAEHGGAHGVRAGGDALVDSAVERPRQRFGYEPDSDLPALAAAYLFGIAKNHGYIDGNKRVAFAVAATFLLLNGVRLTATEMDAYDLVVGVAAGARSEAEVATWIRRNNEPVGPREPWRPEG